MSKFFAGFLIALSFFVLFLGLTSLEKANHLFLLLWFIIGAFSVYKLCAKPLRAA
jgi:hypothetical protein